MVQYYLHVMNENRDSYQNYVQVHAPRSRKNIKELNLHRNVLCWVSQWVICKCYIYITLYSIFVSVILRNQLQIEFPNIHSGWCWKRNIDLLQRLFQHIRLLRSYTTTTLYQHPLDSQLMLLFLHHKGYYQQSIV